MNRDISDTALDQIYDFILEISKGNFTLQLESGDKKDLETLVLLLNMMNEELNTLFHHIHSEKSRPSTLLLSFLITRSLEIKFVSKDTLNHLDFTTAPNKLAQLLTRSSAKKLELIFSKNIEPQLQKKFKLTFKTRSGLLLKTKVEIEKCFQNSDDLLYLLNATKIIYRNRKLEQLQNKSSITHSKYPSRNRSILLQENREMIKRLRDHLLKNLDRKFPGIKELAALSNASESKIKKGFKHYYGTSIYKYFKEKRFEKAHLLLTQTEKPISTIARECGFVSPAHFSRSFKEYFDYRPSDVQRKLE